MKIEIIGYIAAILTTISFLPQTYQAWKSKDLAGISLSMYLLFTLGVAFWIYYGYLYNSWPVIVANSITLLMSSTILYLKIKSNYF